MCTVTWWHSADGYELYFNRDELKRRLPARPPGVGVLDCVPYLSPRDGDAGGTWLLVNKFAVTVGLINEYPPAVPDTAVPPVSRGLLVRAMASCHSVDELSDRLRDLDLSPYKPFLMLGIEPGHSGTCHIWDGRVLKVSPNASSQLPFTSSSYLTEDVARYRRRKFLAIIEEKGDVTRDDLLAFHHQHSISAGAHSVFMRRGDAETVSFTQVNVSPSQVKMADVPTGSKHPPFSEPITITLSRELCTA